MPKPPPKQASIASCFCLDTSFLINGWRKHYCRHVFPSLWSLIEQKIANGQIYSCFEVLEELRERDDDLFGWADSRKTAFCKPSSDTTAEVKKIMREFPNFAAMGGSSNRADPWVVAQAIVLNAVVVTDEHPAEKQKSTKPPKIPDVCNAKSVSWLKPIEFLQAIGCRL